MRQLMAASRNSNLYEVNLVHPKCKNPQSLPVYNDQYSDQLNCIDKNGNVKVSDQPGLGVKYDWEYIEKNKLQTLILD